MGVPHRRPRRETTSKALVPQQLKCVVFDLDGTLVESELDGHRVAFNRAFRDHGLDWQWSEEIYTDLLNIAGGRERILHYLRAYLADSRPESAQQSLANRLHATKSEYLRALIDSDAIPARPGVIRLLNECRLEKIRIAVATTASAENAGALLKGSLGAELADAFDFVALGEMVTAKKPSPEVYRLVLKQLGLRPGTCIAIEDSDIGLRAALGAGIQTLVTPSHFTRHDHFSGACVVASNLGEPGAPAEINDTLGSTTRGFVDVAFLDSLLVRTGDG